MKRRIDEIGGRPEVTSSGINSGCHIEGSGGSGGYVRAPPIAPTIAVGTIPGVVTGPATSISNTGIVHNTHDHPSQSHSHSGYSGAKVEMHPGIHQSMPAYATSIPSGNQQQGVVIGSHEGGRPVGSTIVPSGVVSSTTIPIQSSGQGTHLPQTQHVLQHGNTPTAIVRPRVSAGPVAHPTPPPPTMGPGAAAIAACTAVASNNQVAGQFQRLKVEDALSYLDQVKLRFGRQPQVYNDFLDIMKEFKSQSIDTPGVIARVSQLFRGHPELIVGFNTFLPPGYKIEVQGSDQVSVSVPGQQTTVVHTPQGIHHHVTPTPHQSAPTASVTVKPTVPPIVHSSRSNLGSVNQHVPNAGTVVSNVIANVPSNVLNANPNAPPCHAPAVLSASLVTPLPSGPSTPITNNSIATQNSNNCGGNNGSGMVNNSSGNNMNSGSIASLSNHRDPQAQPSVAVPPLHHPLHPPAAQPVEFNHAINYVNKIKHRFQGQPDIYKQFLEILHTYQKEQKHIKEGGSIPTRTLTEAEVYEKVAKLFENQEDLLQEFGQFLPDATNNTAAQAAVSDFMDQCRSNQSSNKALTNDHAPKKASLKTPVGPPTPNNVLPVSGNSSTAAIGVVTHNSSPTPALYGGGGQQMKRPLSCSGPTHGVTQSLPPTKKPKLSYLKDMSAAEAGKFATLSEYAFFDQVRKALRQEEIYHNFLRCITLFNEEIISRSELVQMIHPFLAKFPDLLKWFKEFIGYRDGANPATDIIPASVAKQERISGDLALEIDYTTCKRLGASYCALPKSHPQPKCSGRNALCREVLNDTWVSFPSWSEDSTFVTSRKTQYEEYIYRCEDERFELDVVLETNLATMRILEAVQKKLQRMSPEEAARFRLDDTLGGSSPTISQRAIKRIYGDKALDILDGLKKNPVIAVPLVLRRLKSKDEEWREAQKGFNKVWREQNERYYLKSLDHQGLTFKQNDVKSLRSKSLLNEIETLYDERHEQAEEGGEVVTGPHMILSYKDKAILDDAANLIIHHVKRQTAIHKDDKAKIKQLVRQFLPDLFFHPRMELSDDEKDIEDDEEDLEEETKETAKSDCSGKNGAKNDKESKESKLSCSTSPEFSTNGNGHSSKRKTRSNKCTDADKEDACTKVAVKECAATNSTNNNSVTKVNNALNNKITVNGDASEVEKNLICSDIKCEIKREPKSPEEVKPVAFSAACSSLADDEYRLFFGNNNWYLFLRLHQIMCHRLTAMYDHAVKIAADETKDSKDRKESTAVALRLKPKNEIPVEDYYPALLEMVQNMLDGNLESTTFEDTLREMYGINAYTAFTLDKVVSGAVRQLQHIVCDDTPSHCMSNYLHEARKGGAGGPIASAHRRLPQEHIYQKKSEKLLQDENCLKIFTYKRDTRMTIELIDTEMEESEENCINATSTNNASINGSENNHNSSPNPLVHSVLPPGVAEVERWSEYVEKYATSVSPQVTPAMQAQLSRKPVFLPRNIRSWKRRAMKQSSISIDSTKNGSSTGQQMEVIDNTQCKFNLSNFKMVFIVNSDSFMYKKHALQRARESHKMVSRLKKSNMNRWLGSWCDDHVTNDEESSTIKWFMGEIEGLRPNKTKLKRIDKVNKSPYSPFNKYVCELTLDNHPPS